MVEAFLILKSLQPAPQSLTTGSENLDESKEVKHPQNLLNYGLYSFWNHLTKIMTIWSPSDQIVFILS